MSLGDRPVFMCFAFLKKQAVQTEKVVFFHFTTGENKPDLIFSSPEPGSIPWFEQGKVTEVAVDELPNGKSAAIKILGKANNHDATLKLLVSNRGDDIKLQLQENGKDIEEFGCVRSVPPPPPKEGIK